MNENSYKRRDETPEEREKRLAKHKRTVAFIAGKYFNQMENPEGNAFYECTFCQENKLDSEQEAADHYFKNHHEHKKEGRNERRS